MGVLANVPWVGRAAVVPVRLVRAGVYARISSDREGDGLGVERQLADCLALAEQKEWRVVERYVDNDTSAYSGKRRVEYERMLDDIRAGRIDGVLVYHLDRLHRQPKELEEFFEVCKLAGVDSLATVTGRIDLADPDGQFQARILGAVAKKESDDKSRRIRRKHDELALNGKVSGGGSRPYGYEKDRVTIRKAEASVIRECARRLIAGESLRNITIDLNARGIPTVGGKQWSPQGLRRVLGSARISGEREHNGEIVAAAEWKGIISKADGARIRNRLADPERRTNREGRKYLLGKILVCSRCGGFLIARPRAQQVRRYACAKGPGLHGCGKTYINADDAEDFVASLVIERLDSAELQASLAGRRAEPDAERWYVEVDEAKAQLDELAAAYGEQLFTMSEFLAARKPIEARLQQAQSHVKRVTQTSVLDEFVGKGKELAEQWDTLDLSQRHALVSNVLEQVVVGPGRRGYNKFDESRLTISWRL